MMHSDHELNIAATALWFGRRSDEPVDAPDIEELLATFGPAAVDVVVSYLFANSLIRVVGDAV